MASNAIPDDDGNTWQPFENEFQQRKLRCVSGPRVGDVIDDSRAEPPRAPRKRAQYVGDEFAPYDF